MLDWWLPSRLEKAVARLSPEFLPWATSSSSTRALRARSKIHRRGSEEGREKSITARRGAAGRPAPTAQSMAARALASTALSWLGAARARVSASRVSGWAGIRLAQAGTRTARRCRHWIIGWDSLRSVDPPTGGGAGHWGGGGVN